MYNLSLGTVRNNAVDRERIIILKIIFTRRIGVARVLNLVSPSIIPVIIARIRVKGKMNAEKISTSLIITGWKSLKKDDMNASTGMAITRACER